MKHLFFWLLRMSRCNLNQYERINPRLLPPHLFRHFGEAMLVKIEACYRLKSIMIQLQLRIWSEFLGQTRISKRFMRYLLARISRRERECPIPSILPLSAVVKQRNYQERVGEAVSSAKFDSIFLNRSQIFVKGNTNEPIGHLDRVEHQITHKNGNFDAIIVCGGVLMGRNCPLGLKMRVLKSPWRSEEKATTCIFHHSDQILIVGRANGTVDFYQFTDDLESVTPSFTMILLASLPFSGKTPSSVRRITQNPSGSLFVIEYNHSSSVLVSMDAQNKIAFSKQFVSELLTKCIGSLSAVTFFGSNMLLTAHYNKNCVWDMSDLEDIKLLSEIEPIMSTDGSRNFNTEIVQQIITCGDLSFLLRTTKMIVLVRLGDDFKTCNIVAKLPVYGIYSAGTMLDFEHDSIALFGKLLILVVPSQRVVKFFLLEDDAIRLLLTKQIETLTCWSYNPWTSVFSYYTRTLSHFTIEYRFRV